MNSLYAGFSRVNVTPMNGIFISGYYRPRYASGALDELELNAIALGCGDTRVVLLALDNCEGPKPIFDRFRAAIAERTGLPLEAIFIHCTHIHTGPQLNPDDPAAADPAARPLVMEYLQFLEHKMADAAAFALEDLKPAKMGYAFSEADNIAFVRRFLMKDGSIQTNPGVDNPDIVAPIGEPDKRVNVLRFDREGAETIALVNFGNHPDVIGGDKVTADWPGFTRRILERALDNTRAIFFNGAQGDVNHVNVHPGKGWNNGRGYDHARHMGNVVAGAVLKVFEKVAWTDVDSIRFDERIVRVPSSMPKPEDMPEAQRIYELHCAGRAHELPYRGMMNITVVAEACRMVKLEHGPEFFDMPVMGISIGNVAFCGLPGEPFTGIGVGIKEAKGWDMVLPCALVNGCFGYFPMQEAYDEGGYEARSSEFKPGVAEKLIEASVAMLDDMR